MTSEDSKTPELGVGLQKFRKKDNNAADAMPHLFRTTDGAVRKPDKPFPLQLLDGSTTEGLSVGCAQHEKSGWCLKKPGNQLARSAEVFAIAIKGEQDSQIRWGDAPKGAHLFFVIELPKVEKSSENYRLANGHGDGRAGTGRVFPRRTFCAPGNMGQRS